MVARHAVLPTLLRDAVVRIGEGRDLRQVRHASDLPPRATPGRRIPAVAGHATRARRRSACRPLYFCSRSRLRGACCNRTNIGPSHGHLVRAQTARAVRANAEFDSGGRHLKFEWQGQCLPLTFRCNRRAHDNDGLAGDRCGDIRLAYDTGSRAAVGHGEFGQVLARHEIPIGPVCKVTGFARRCDKSAIGFRGSPIW